jgi:hypothetical protein
MCSRRAARPRRRRRRHLAPRRPPCAPGAQWGRPGRGARRDAGPGPRFPLRSVPGAPPTMGRGVSGGPLGVVAYCAGARAAGPSGRAVLIAMCRAWGWVGASGGSIVLAMSSHLGKRPGLPHAGHPASPGLGRPRPLRGRARCGSLGGFRSSRAPLRRPLPGGDARAGPGARRGRSLTGVDQMTWLPGVGGGAHRGRAAGPARTHAPLPSAAPVGGAGRARCRARRGLRAVGVHAAARRGAARAPRPPLPRARMASRAALAGRAPLGGGPLLRARAPPLTLQIAGPPLLSRPLPRHIHSTPRQRPHPRPSRLCQPARGPPRNPRARYEGVVASAASARGGRASGASGAGHGAAPTPRRARAPTQRGAARARQQRMRGGPRA